MKRRRKARTSGNELRRLALAGRWEDVRALLATRLARNPEDAEARAELERLQQGLPLRATESALTRKRREEQEMREELEAELTLFRNKPDVLETWEPALIDKRRRRIALIRSALGKRLPEELYQAAEHYHNALAEKLGSHRSKRRGCLLLGIGLPLLLMAAGSAGLYLHQRAQDAEESLRQAMQAQDSPRIERALNLADSGINCLFNSRLAEQIRLARIGKAQRELRLTELQHELVALETGETHISTLPLIRRAEYEQTLRTLPPDKAELRERWQRLCNKESQALARQREEVAQRFRAPLPALPASSSHPAEDDVLLKQQQDELSLLAREWQAARELFKLEDAWGDSLNARLSDIRQVRADIAALRRAVALLPSARTYAQYRDILGRHEARLYAPALAMKGIHDILPDEDKLRDLMRDHGRQLPPGMLEAARHALVEGGPSFTPAFPANAQQLQYMEDVFTAKVLQEVLYEMSAHTLPSVIVEERPLPGEDSVSFTPSPLDPAYTLDTPQRITWHNPQGVYIRRIDTTTLLPESGIRRDHFFSRSNLPSLLDALLRFEHKECPTLARAYVFKRLLEVMNAHEWPTMLGIAYAPTMRADARSFSQIVGELGFPLEAGCWLRSTPEVREAEQHFAQWFHERRHRNYAQEIARNFKALVQVHPRYIGFIDEGGKVCLYRKLAKGTLIWYLSEEGLTTTPMGDALEAPVSYSPVFIVAKD